MKLTRRLTLAFAVMAPIVLSLGAQAQAKTVKYSAKLYDQYVQSGQTFLLGVHANWCSTCDRQKRVIRSLRETGAPYQELTVMVVDWDHHRRSPLIGKLNIPRRSTLVMYKKGREVGRIVAGTSVSQIKGLIDRGL